MPSIEAPTHYERSKFIASSRADDFLRRIDPDFYVADTGHVESPFGHVALVKVTDEDVSRWVNGQIDGDLHLDPENVEPGWYIVRTNSDGLVWGIGYGPDATLNEESARADFAEAEAAYAAWDAAFPDNWL